MLVWRNSYTFRFPKASRATPATIGKRWVKILSRLVATLTDFLRKGQLVCVLCRSHKNFNSQYKIKGRVKIFFNVQSHMSYPRPNEADHFQANLIWWDGPFKPPQESLLSLPARFLCLDKCKKIPPGLARKKNSKQPNSSFVVSNKKSHQAHCGIVQKCIKGTVSPD